MLRGWGGESLYNPIIRSHSFAESVTFIRVSQLIFLPLRWDGEARGGWLELANIPFSKNALGRSFLLIGRHLLWGISEWLLPCSTHNQTWGLFLLSSPLEPTWGYRSKTLWKCGGSPLKLALQDLLTCKLVHLSFQQFLKHICVPACSDSSGFCFRSAGLWSLHSPDSPVFRVLVYVMTSFLW